MANSKAVQGARKRCGLMSMQMPGVTWDRCATVPETEDAED